MRHMKINRKQSKDDRKLLSFFSLYYFMNFCFFSIYISREVQTMKKALIILIVVICYFQRYDYIDLSRYQSELIHVEVKGEIKRPNVYELHYQSKLEDLIEKAGGFKDKADTSSLNMNKDLHDKDVIVIQKIDQNTKEKISINAATLEQLTQLNGVGPATAQKIIDYRNQVGSFQSLEEIMNISGIKEKLFAKIKDYICL